MTSSRICRRSALHPLLIGAAIVSCEGPFDPFTRTVSADGVHSGLPAEIHDAVARDGVWFQGGVNVVHTTPPQLGVTVYARDAEGLPAAVTDAGCPLEVRAYRSEGGIAAGAAPGPWQGASPVWTSGIREEDCVGHGGSVGFVIPVLDVLGDSLPSAPYTLTAVLHLDDEPLELGLTRPFLHHDDRPPVRDRSGLVYAVESRLEGHAPTTLVTEVTVMNRGERRVRFEFGACALRVHAFALASAAVGPAWRSEHRRPPGSPHGYACPSYLRGAVLSPGESFAPGEFRLVVPRYEILGDSLGAGRYRLEAMLTLLDDSVGPPDWEEILRFHAGSVELDDVVERMPEERVRSGIRFRAEPPIRIGGDSLRFRVTLTNTTTRRAALSLARDCGLGMFAYRRREDRDAIPVRSPDLAVPSGCVLYTVPFPLDAGEEREIVHSVAVPVLEGAAGPGPWYFTSSVVLQTGVVLLAAGSAN